MIPTAIPTDSNLPSSNTDDSFPCVFLDAALNNSDAADWCLDLGQVQFPG